MFYANKVKKDKLENYLKYKIKNKSYFMENDFLSSKILINIFNSMIYARFKATKSFFAVLAFFLGTK